MKYQIFVSSTYEDLRTSRDIVIKAILEMGHIPVGMEMFSAADEEQWKVIQRQIDDSDYYLVIAAHRYGSLDGKVSFTEKEYNYALLKKVPTLGFILNEKAEWPVVHVDKDRIAKQRLNRFKLKIKEKPVGFWNTSEELHAKVSIALMKAFITNPRPGWSRVTASVGPEVTNELSRLSVENAQLRELNDKLLSEAGLYKRQREEIETTIPLLNAKLFKISIRFDGEPGWINGPEVSLYAIFNFIAPFMVVECGVDRMARTLARTYCLSIRQSGDKISKTWPIARNTFYRYLSFFKALDLIELSDQRSGANDNQYWKLTKKGERLHNANLLKVLEIPKISTLVPEGNDPDLVSE